MSGSGEGGPWKWVALAAVLVGLGARLWIGQIEERERQETYDTSGDVWASVQLDELERIAPPGTDAATYADSVATHFDSWRHRWYAGPLTHRMTATMLVGEPTVEVVFRGDTVAEARVPSAVEARPELPADSAAALLGLPADHPIFP